MSDDFGQITIPDFDDDDVQAIPHGRPQGLGAFGGSGGLNFGDGSMDFGQDSPTSIQTPIPSNFDRSGHAYVHSRNDSAASEDSVNSFRPPTNPKSSSATAFHSSTSSIATTVSTSFSRKTSFASIRAAFKSGKINDAPPVPTIDHQAYPVLKNPFNRSNSSLTQVPTSSTRRPSVAVGITPSPSQGRAPTPNEYKSRVVNRHNRGHGPARSQHSTSGSIFNNSDGGGSEFGLPRSSSPPPMPRFPNGYNGYAGRMGTPPLEESESKIEPRTPSDFALHAVFMRFASTAETKIDQFLRQPLEREQLLPEYFGTGVDAEFDGLLSSLGQIAQKHSRPVVDSVMRWRKSHNDTPDADVVRFHMMQSPTNTRQNYRSGNDTMAALSERKSLASIYVMCRALIAVMQSISKDALGEAMAYSLEDITFEQFKKPDIKLLMMSANHRINAELYATLLGLLSNVRFVSVTDRFLAELAPVASGQVPKDDVKYENLVKGLRHLQIKVWPPESFEEGAEFMETLSKSFENAHGQRLKIAFAESLVHLLHPIGKTAQAEVNHPMWAKAMETIYPKARDMMNKPRYWHAAYPLVVTSLCVAPSDYFLRNWIPCFEAGVNKLKEKPNRMIVLNGMVRLVWTYLYRCREAATTASGKLDNILRFLFPAKGTSLAVHDEKLEPFVYIVHFILSRHFEYGKDLVLNLLQESAISSAPPSGITHLLAPERMTIALRAILLTLNALERDEPTPTWPSNADFTVVPSAVDYPTSADFVPESLLAKPGMQDFFNRCGPVVSSVAVSCRHPVGRMSVFDDQWSHVRSAGYDEMQMVIRKHPEGTVGYPVQLTPQIQSLELCFNSWPRCLHPSMAMQDAVDMLIRGVIHVEPAVGEAATQALKRIATNHEHAPTVLSRFVTLLCDANHIARELSNLSMLVESPRLLQLWVSLVDGWVHMVVGTPHNSITEEDRSSWLPLINEIETGALFILSFMSLSVRVHGVQLLRMVNRAMSHIDPEPPLTPGFTLTERTERMTDLLNSQSLRSVFLQNHDEFLDSKLQERLSNWLTRPVPNTLLRIANSDDSGDRQLWIGIYSNFLRHCADILPTTVAALRESVSAAVVKYHPVITGLSGPNLRSPTQNTRAAVERDQDRAVHENSGFISQWYTWTRILCTTTTATGDSRPVPANLPRNHARLPSEMAPERETLSSSRSLIRYISPFLDSDYSIFRDTAVYCLSAFPLSAYPQLLEDLNSAARPLYDGGRSDKPMLSRGRRQERLHTAVARVYYLTTHMLKDLRSSGRQAALVNILKFVRNTQSYLSSSEVREKHTLQRLRRHFCGTVERFFDGLESLKDFDRFIPSNMHLSLYRLCEEWVQSGPQPEYIKHRLVVMQTAALNAGENKGEAVTRFQTETMTLSTAAIGALAALVHKAHYPSEQASSSPTDRPLLEYLTPLGTDEMLDRLSGILAAHNTTIQNRGKKALRSLLIRASQDPILLEIAMKRAMLTSEEMDTSNGRFFEVVVDVICETGGHGFSFSQAVLLGLSNLCHPIAHPRQRAFDLIETIHLKTGGEQSLGSCEAAVGSKAPATFLGAHRTISSILAEDHPDQAMDVLSQFTRRLLESHKGTLHRIPSLLLQSLGCWLQKLTLMDGNASLSADGKDALLNMMALTQKYWATHTKPLQDLWESLVESSPGPNAHATVRFLVEHSQKVGTPKFVQCAANIVSFLSRTVSGPQVFADLCGILEPDRMLPSYDHHLEPQDADITEFWDRLNSLFAADSQKLTLGAGQFALLFLNDMTLERAWDSHGQLPVILQALIVHVDHRSSYVRQQARRMLYQVLRWWVPGYEELSHRNLYPSRVQIKENIRKMETGGESVFWTDDESSASSLPKMRSLCPQILELLEPLHPTVSADWGSLALRWGTACSIRHIAFRSLQIFRALMPRVTQVDLAFLLGRLSNTVSAPDANIQSFSLELILSLISLADSSSLDPSLLPQMFWCASACLSTTVEQEFLQVVTLLDSMLNRLDFDDLDTVEILLEHQPTNWIGSASGLQQPLLTGLRSSVTSGPTFALLKRLAKVRDSRLIDSSDGRVRDLYTAVLPWCLQAMESNTQDEGLQEFASSIAELAEEEDRPSISRIMISFVKSRFRTKDDFLRQAVMSLREHYGKNHWSEVVTLLLGLVLNSDRWLRVKSMQVLKVLFQQRETKNPFDLLGPELLMPLLRLLQSDLASNALEVLEEPMAISTGGPAAKDVLRMSIYKKPTREVEAAAEVFGVPKDSGWCVPRPDHIREICRANVLAVFDTCKIDSRPSHIFFEPEAGREHDMGLEDLGDLVQNLHELSNFFQESPYRRDDVSPHPGPNRALEARVAAILAKSTETAADIPETPYVDAFKVADRMTVYEESDDDSDTSERSEPDAFAFDSPSHGRGLLSRTPTAF